MDTDQIFLNYCNIMHIECQHLNTHEFKVGSILISIGTDKPGYITLSNEYIESLQETKDDSFLYDDLPQNAGYQKKIRYYHKSIWHARRSGYESPYEYWQRKDLTRLAENRLKYIQKIDKKALRQGLTIAKLAQKVSIFKYSLADRLVKAYLQDYTQIFDPFSGFSARALGVLTNNKIYIGQDLNKEHIDETLELLSHERFMKYHISQKDIFDSTGRYEALFTCSPYSNKEIWNDNDTDLTCDQWIDVCLERFDCQAYLFVVDKTEKYKDFIVESIRNKSHFGTNYEQVIFFKKEQLALSKNTFVCKKCNKERKGPSKTGICRYCNREAALLEQYGVTNVFQLNSTKAAIKETVTQKYGVDNIAKVDQLKEARIEKYKKTVKERKDKK